MTSYHKKALLPAGFHDLLSDEAAFSESITRNLTECFQHYGYHYVNPPLIEFETSLLAGQGHSLSAQTFRLMDPYSHQMMGVRPDITMQIVRIATTRLHNTPLPLRLSYAGPVLRVKGTYLYGERQLMQAGIELIGAKDTVSSNAEVIITALDALKKVGVTELSVDFNLPGLASILLEALHLDNETKHNLQQALNKKESAQVAELAGEHAALLLELLIPTGNTSKMLMLLKKTGMPEGAKILAQNLEQVIDLVSKAQPSVKLTIDPLEYRGFEYHTGIGFSLFSRDSAIEVGRGGRYKIEMPQQNTPLTDEAVGVTLDINTLLRILPTPASKKKIFIPAGISYEETASLRAQGLITIHGMQHDADPLHAASDLKCDMVYMDGKLVDVVYT